PASCFSTTHSPSCRGRCPRKKPFKAGRSISPASCRVIARTSPVNPLPSCPAQTDLLNRTSRPWYRDLAVGALLAAPCPGQGKPCPYTRCTNLVPSGLARGNGYLRRDFHTNPFFS